ncbi:hypothetical protein [Mesorhizobium sp. M1322]|uniref:hypothetical protein n=1 Tax=Mesorhizobium sp. M1322 TaxID=2957081 RepID=UPI0033357249
MWPGFGAMGGAMKEKLAAIGEADALALPQRQPRNHWPFFFVLLVPAYLLNAATSSSWAAAAGYVAVPAVIGYFILKRATSFGVLAAGYMVFAAILFGLVGKDAYNAVEGAEKSILTGCMERNEEVAQLPSEQEKNTYCTCYSGKMATPVVWMASTAFLTFRQPTPIQNNPQMISIATEASMQCAALL